MRRLPAYPGTSEAIAGPESPSLAGGIIAGMGTRRGNGGRSGERLSPAPGTPPLRAGSP
jgi:hypothetical protein